MEVTFTRAKFSSRVLAFGFDLLCMIICSLFLVIGARYLVGSFSFYKEATQELYDVQYASHLYYKELSGDLTIICDHYEPNSEEECHTYNEELHHALSSFYKDEKFFDQTDPNSGYSLYIQQRLDTGSFIYTDDSHTEVAPKADVSEKDIYKIYSSLMKNDANKYLVKQPGYVEATKTINLSFIFLILLLPITIIVTLFEYVVPLIFHNGKKTFGKLIFKLAVVDTRGLSPTFARFSCRFLLFLFGEILLSAVSFFIPIFISSAMFAFSKNNQSFHDYVTATYVVDTSEARTFETPEAYFEAHKKAEEFELKKDDINYD